MSIELIIGIAVVAVIAYVILRKRKPGAGGSTGGRGPGSDAEK